MFRVLVLRSEEKSWILGIFTSLVSFWLDRLHSMRFIKLLGETGLFARLRVRCLEAANLAKMQVCSASVLSLHRSRGSIRVTFVAGGNRLHQPMSPCNTLQMLETLGPGTVFLLPAQLTVVFANICMLAC